MSGITLTASVRQNLLSLQSTADLLSTTQNRLATGNKVNSALDNPTNFFTAQGLNNRAGDINNLLDGIGNGVQILQAANTGITSLQKLVDSAKSIANQALQATSGYSTKSTATTAAVTGATADNLLGTAGATAGTVTAGAFTAVDASTTGTSFTVAIDGAPAKTITIDAAAVTAYNTAKGTSLVSTALTAQNIADMTNYQIDSTGATTIATVAAGALKFTSTTVGASSSIALTLATTPGSGSTGIVAATNTGAPPNLSGKTLTIAATDGGVATNITFGPNLKTLDQLNTALAANNLQASISSDGKLSFTTTNDHASVTIGAFGGTAVAAGAGLFGAAVNVNAPVADANAQNTRSSLVAQYNTVIDQIKTTAADSSFNGVNLLNGDTLALTFNETGKSKLSISGVTFDPAGLGLSSLTKGTDFLDNTRTNTVLTNLTNASSKLRSQASAFGSNLSVVQMRQDFSKQMINVLQNGASALTLADTNEEAANSQALSTRQSIAVSALSLANQSQQGVLQLLR